MEPTKKATIVYLVDPRDKLVLLPIKMKDPGAGCRFGYGGKIENGEDPDTAICRETKEESGGKINRRLGITLQKKDLERVALIDFYKGSDRPFGNPTFQVLCYRALRWTGEAHPTDEMSDPKLFSTSALPKSNMKPGDELFVPQIIAGTPVKGWIRFTEDSKTVLESDIAPCAESELVI